MYAFIKNHRSMHVRSMHLTVCEFYNFYFYPKETRGGAESEIRKEVCEGCFLDSRCWAQVLTLSSPGDVVVLSTKPELSQ